MELEDNFEFVSDDEILLKGHRMGIETIIYEYLDGRSPEEIVLRYHTLSLSEINATIRYYDKNRQKIDQYLRVIEERYNKRLRQQEENPSPAVLRLRELREQRLAPPRSEASAAVH